MATSYDQALLVLTISSLHQNRSHNSLLPGIVNMVKIKIATLISLILKIQIIL